MKPFILKGVIQLVNRVIRVGGDECYGTTEVDGRRFKIRLSSKAIESVDDFLNTALHEFFHLWLFIAMAVLRFNMSAAASHRIIDKAVPVAMKQFYIEYKPNRKRK